MTTLYIDNHYITTLDELKTIIKRTESPTSVLGRQLLSAVCDGLMSKWFKESDNSVEQSMAAKLSPEKFINMSGDVERLNVLRSIFDASLEVLKRDYDFQIVSKPDISQLLNIYNKDTYERDTVAVKFAFKCSEVLDEKVKFKVLDIEQYLDFNKQGIQTLIFNVPWLQFKAIKEIYLTAESSDKKYWNLNLDYYVANGVLFRMIPVQGGTYTMGATSEQGSDAFYSEKPAHKETVSDFMIGETPVTQELWQAVMGSNPSNFKGDMQRPVEQVLWDDCQTFIRKLNQLTGQNFRLPTEAEWEYAARGGNRSQGYKYSGSNRVRPVAWYNGNSGSTTHKVKTKQPNELGIYDMSGNVWEWCQDKWCDDYNSPRNSGSHVLRGGSWDTDAGSVRVSNRSHSDSPYSRYFIWSSYIGLRLAL